MYRAAHSRLFGDSDLFKIEFCLVGWNLTGHAAVGMIQCNGYANYVMRRQLADLASGHADLLHDPA